MFKAAWASEHQTTTLAKGTFNDIFDSAVSFNSMSLFARTPRVNPHDREHADLYLAEARGRLDRMRARSGSFDTRAGLLISSTAVASVLQGTLRKAPETPTLGGAIALAAIVAMVLGVLVLASRKGSELNDDVLRERIVSGKNDPYIDSFWVADKHLEHAKAGEKIAVRKGRLLNWGFLALAVAVVLSLIP